MATLKEIARNLNLSAMAVSKALRDAPDISAATKARVKAEAQRLDYVPNQAARNLRACRSHLLGVVVPQINHPYFSNIVWGIERQAEASGYQILLGHSLDAASHEVAEVRKLLARQVDALLLVPAVRWQDRLATLELASSRDVPVVLLDRFPAGANQFPRVTWIVNNDRLGAEKATQHLLELGHREILFFAGPHGSSSSAARLEGYRRAMADSPAGQEDRRVFLAGHGIEGGEKAMSQVLDEGAPCTALVAFNDSVAFGAIDLLLRQGQRIPHDISVVGFGDSLLARHFRVPLTTMHCAVADMGSAAVQAALELIAHCPVQPRELNTELIIRESTGPVRP
jgi:DNA-binding LacI/PurR family transcriptional regulator